MTSANLAALLSDHIKARLPATVAVGWSGGADSTALLLALKEAGFNVQAWHIDHGWRQESASEAGQLATWAEQWNITFRLARLSEVPNSNLEADARKHRYAQFSQWADETGISTLCLGHHRDDQAETVCMRMLQGAGVAGCRGMAETRQWQSLTIIRPLLESSASKLKAALHSAGITWLKDPSNDDTRLLRNHIRHRLFRQIEVAGHDPALLFLRWQKQACRIADALDKETAQLLSHAEAGVPWQQWRAVTPAIRARALQQLMRRTLGDGITPGRRHIELIEIWTQRNGRGGLDLSRCRLYKSSGRLHLAPVASD